MEQKGHNVPFVSTNYYNYHLDTTFLTGSQFDDFKKQYPELANEDTVSMITPKFDFGSSILYYDITSKTVLFDSSKSINPPSATFNCSQYAGKYFFSLYNTDTSIADYENPVNLAVVKDENLNEIFIMTSNNIRRLVNLDLLPKSISSIEYMEVPEKYVFINPSLNLFLLKKDIYTEKINKVSALNYYKMDEEAKDAFYNIEHKDFGKPTNFQHVTKKDRFGFFLGFNNGSRRNYFLQVYDSTGILLRQFKLEFPGMLTGDVSVINNHSEDDMVRLLYKNVDQKFCLVEVVI